MADPFLNEQNILAALDVPASVGTVDRLQTAAMLAIVDGFDRKIQRDPFILLTASGLGLHTNMGRLHLINRVIELHKTQKLTPEKLTEADIELLAVCEAERIGLLNKSRLVSQCPLSTDKIS
jgi:hypothetical protein